MGYISDIALDTSPISGGTTTLHTLWMGLPIVCMDAERGVDSATARTLRGLGLSEGVAKNTEDYINAALDLMDNVEYLKNFRLNIRSRMQKSGLMNYKVRTAELEKAYRLMWLNWLAGEYKALNTAANMDEILEEMDCRA